MIRQWSDAICYRSVKSTSEDVSNSALCRRLKVYLDHRVIGGRTNIKVFVSRKEVYTFFIIYSSEFCEANCPAALALHSLFHRGCWLGAQLLHERIFANLNCTPTRVLFNAAMALACPCASPCGLPGTRFLRPRKNKQQIFFEDKWSSLPVILIWMIKDKLDFFGNSKLAVVCRDWFSASTLYPKKQQSVGDRMPWIMQWTESTIAWGLRFVNVKTEKRGAISLPEFINVATEMRFTIDLPEFIGTEVLSTNEGWFLLRKTNSSDPKNRLLDNLLLINPFTGSKIKVPDLGVGWSAYHGSFSVNKSHPCCLVLDKNRERFDQVTLAITHVGDEVWTEHSYDVQGGRGIRLSYLGITGELVLCFDHQRLIIYNMASQVWKELVEEFSHVHFVEWEGRLVKVRVCFCWNTFFEFFSYNDSNTDWDRLSSDDLKDTSWFLFDTGGGFSKRTKGSMVYSLCVVEDTIFMIFCMYEATIYDLVRGTTQTIPYRFPVSSAWVDIG